MDRKQKATIEEIKQLVKGRFENDSSGHDWWHIYRVWNMAKELARKEDANVFIVELAALLHDIADWKFYDGDEKAGGRTARQILTPLDLDPKIIESVVNIIDQVSFKGAGVTTNIDSIEGQVVQDADRLDAIGAIGIARTFAYGGSKGRLMYHPSIKHEEHQTFEAYKSSKGPTINHFYEKLLLLRDRMNTLTAKKMAKQRHEFMELYLDEFMKEWDGKL